MKVDHELFQWPEKPKQDPNELIAAFVDFIDGVDGIKQIAVKIDGHCINFYVNESSDYSEINYLAQRYMWKKYGSNHNRIDGWTFYFHDNDGTMTQLWPEDAVTVYRYD